MSLLELHASQQLLVGEALKSAVHYSPNRTAFIHNDHVITFKQLYRNSSYLAGWLQRQGVTKNDKVACIYKNGIPFVELYFACSLIGAVIVPQNYRLSLKEWSKIIHHSDAKFIFLETDFLKPFEDIRESLPHIEEVIVTEEPSGSSSIVYSSILEKKIPYETREELNDHDPHVIVYTSGTTGEPKGVVLTHKNFYINGMNKMSSLNQEQHTKTIILPPLFHVATLSLLVQNCLNEGTFVLMNQFEPITVLKTIETELINSLFLVPTMWAALLNVPNFTDYDVRSMKLCSTGASICPLELKLKIKEMFPSAGIYEAFGQTEMSPTTTNLLPEDSLRKTNSVGKPCINVRIRVVDDDLNDVPLGEVGEILYKGPTLMKEYYKNPEATREAFIGGWFHSGDLVRMDDEEFIYVVDRKKDMIISGGENIYSAEVENTLNTHPFIRESAVVGIPDPKWGQSVLAYIVLEQESALSKEEVIVYCQSELASYKKPRYIEFLDELPRNASGKILKIALREVSL
ncbi:long-chain-fatty-acid--CoA ligase [Peribacillus psychrosaccharolyticus]|uniref:class I adenylate-forming enzyme family protein n=1 Tax=Peribacillus psychrosaccharolyticus TaxID=1407 RepID=UPI003D2767F6